MHLGGYVQVLKVAIVDKDMNKCALQAVWH